jgi:hypothetical protein
LGSGCGDSAVGSPIHGGGEVFQVVPARRERLCGLGPQRPAEEIAAPNLGGPRFQLGQVLLVLLQFRKRVLADRTLTGQLGVKIAALLDQPIVML